MNSAPSKATHSTAAQAGAVADSLRQLLLTLPEGTVARRTDTGDLLIELQLDDATLSASEPVLKVLANYSEHNSAGGGTVADAGPPKTSVLVVDDDPIFRRLLRRVLEDIPGCQVSDAVSGTAALEMLQSGSVPDLCILDFCMPGMDGLQWLHHVRWIPRLAQLNVILCTSAKDRDTVRKAGELGVSGYLLKPFQPSIVREQVRELLEQISRRRHQQWLEIQQRLGLDTEGCAELLQLISTQIRDTVLAIRSLLAAGKEHTATMRVNSLRGACGLLQDALLTSSVQALLDCMNRNNLTETVKCIDALEIEGKRIEMMIAGFSAYFTPTAPKPS